MDAVLVLVCRGRKEVQRGWEDGLGPHRKQAAAPGGKPAPTLPLLAVSEGTARASKLSPALLRARTCVCLTLSSQRGVLGQCEALSSSHRGPLCPSVRGPRLGAPLGAPSPSQIPPPPGKGGGSACFSVDREFRAGRSVKLRGRGRAPEVEGLWR